MTSRAATEYRYEKLTWPEINEAVQMGKVCIVPCGSVEQHGAHLPLDVDIVCPHFPGTINTHYTTFIEQVLDIAKSLAYHGLLTVDKEFLPRWRQSKFPGGCAHACELETSLYLYLDGDNVRQDGAGHGGKG